jgi:hypothetical protein
MIIIHKNLEHYKPYIILHYQHIEKYFKFIFFHVYYWINGQ